MVIVHVSKPKHSLTPNNNNKHNKIKKMYKYYKTIPMSRMRSLLYFMLCIWSLLSHSLFTLSKILHFIIGLYICFQFCRCYLNVWFRINFIGHPGIGGKKNESNKKTHFALSLFHSPLQNIQHSYKQ